MSGEGPCTAPGGLGDNFAHPGAGGVGARAQPLTRLAPTGARHPLPVKRGEGKNARTPFVTLIADPLFYLLAVPAVITLGLSKGGFAGVGQMAVPMLALAIPPLEGAAILLPIMIVQDVISVWVYRKDFSGRILAIMIPAAFIGVGAGWLLAAHISDAAVRTFTGAATLAFVLYSWLGPKRLAADVGAASVPAGIVWGMLSGFASTVASAGAPPYQMYVLPQKLKKMTYVGTTAIMFATVNWMKIIPYVALGQFSTAGLGTSLALLPLAIATNLLGFWLVRVTPTAIFYKVTLIIMFFISIELTREGLGEMLRG
jgi:uncharacterized membrane protein YfcA